MKATGGTIAIELFSELGIARFKLQEAAIGYQGRLTQAGGLANGIYDLQFKLFDTAAAGAGAQQGGTIAKSAVSVANGVFTVTLDFGAAVFDGSPRFLEIGVRPGGSASPYVPLTPRQQVASIPYAIHSLKAETAATATAVVNGAAVRSLNNLKDNVTLAAGANVTITPSGNTLSIASSGGGGGGSGLWSLAGTDAYYNAGNVGIGTRALTAGYRLEVNGATLLRPGNGTVQFGSPNAELGMSITPNAGNRADLRFNGSVLKLAVGTGAAPPAAANGLSITTAGNVGIGSPTPVAKLEVVAQDALRLIGYQPFLTLLDASAGYARGRIQSVGGEIVLEPESFINGSNPNAAVIIANSGNVTVSTLTIRGGADLAEPFELSSSDIAKGSVVIIDSENPGKLALSHQSYDQRVAGVVSGANGVNPGITLRQDVVFEGGQNVALSGRVYVLADAAQGAIKPGDLLTTSDTAGHAMRVSDHAKGHGAILGKAMSGLKEGKGLVLVLVTLQ